jgi:hypothetical protein
MLTNTDTALLWEDVRDTNNPESFPTQYANLSKVSEPCIKILHSISFFKHELSELGSEHSFRQWRGALARYCQ